MDLSSRLHPQIIQDCIEDDFFIQSEFPVEKVHNEPCLDRTRNDQTFCTEKYVA